MPKEPKHADLGFMLLGVGLTIVGTALVIPYVVFQVTRTIHQLKSGVSAGIDTASSALSDLAKTEHRFVHAVKAATQHR